VRNPSTRIGLLRRLIDRHVLELAGLEGGRPDMPTGEDRARCVLILPARVAVVRLLERERDAATPMAQAIEAMTSGPKTIEVRFAAPQDVPAVSWNGRLVKCLRAMGTP